MILSKEIWSRLSPNDLKAKYSLRDAAGRQSWAGSIRKGRLAGCDGSAVLAGVADGPPPEYDAFEGVARDQATLERVKH